MKDEETIKRLDADLARLNDAVKHALRTRKAWMDEHMPDYAKVQVGEEIFDMRTCERLGVVTKLYRYHGDRDPRYDTSMSIEYEFETGRSGCAIFHDNTSRHGSYFPVGTRAEVVDRLRWRADNLKDPTIRESKVDVSSIKSTDLPEW